MIGPKSCPPCNQQCNQSRQCPARLAARAAKESELKVKQENDLMAAAREVVSTLFYIARVALFGVLVLGALT